MCLVPLLVLLAAPVELLVEPAGEDRLSGFLQKQKNAVEHDSTLAKLIVVQKSGHTPYSGLMVDRLSQISSATTTTTMPSTSHE